MEYYKNTPNNMRDFMMEGDEGVFNIEWIKNEYNRYREDEEDESEDHMVSNFIGGYYWGDLHTNGFYDEMTDLFLINYIKRNNEDCYRYLIEYMEEEDNINYIREKIVYMVLEIKVEELVSLKLI